jgi:hypothetical protein
MRHLGGVQGGSVCQRQTVGAGGRYEHPAGSTRVRPVAEDHPEDAGVFAAADSVLNIEGGAPLSAVPYAQAVRIPYNNVGFREAV